jgi:ubiquinone/menaquinone biosynthesis C-methylase UbiE
VAEGESADRARRAWAAGDYARVAEVLLPASAAVVEAAAIGPGEEVLDVAAGTGNLAVLAARAGARVTATDLTPALIELGRARTSAEELEVTWQEADAEALPFVDESFDCVASVFGAIFAPRPERVAAELFRVARPGGRVALTAWVPSGWNGEFMRLLGRASGVPPGVALPPEWGVETTLRARLEPHAERLEVRELVVPWRASSADALLAFIEEAVPPMAAARAAVPGEAYAELREALRAALAEDGAATPEGFAAPAPYLLAVGHKPAVPH